MGREEIELTIREAIPDDAEKLLAFIKETASQTDFLTLDKEGLSLTVREERVHLAKLYQSINNVLFVALDSKEVIGTASLHASSQSKIAHIAELGIVIHKDYWGIGLGSILMEELLDWAETSNQIMRIELKVQEQNDRARKLYEKFGFIEEALMKRGMKVNEEFQSVYLMSKMIH